MQHIYKDKIFERRLLEHRSTLQRNLMSDTTDPMETNLRRRWHHVLRST